MATPNNVNEYIAGFPKDIQERLEQVRAIIKKAVPDAEETIKYAIPTYVYRGNVVSFAGYAKHIGLYPVPAGDDGFENEIAAYKAGKSTAQFPHNAPLPLPLISQLVKLRAQSMPEKPLVKKSN